MSRDGWIHGNPIEWLGGKREDRGTFETVGKGVFAAEKFRLLDGWEDVKSELRYLSPSAIMTADPENEGCIRKWAWQYVAGKKPPETAAQKMGTELHAEIENYLQTGVKDLSALALAGLHMIPTPDLEAIARGENDLCVEVEMGSEFSSKDPEIAFAITVARDARIEEKFDLANEVLRAHGIPTAGGVPLIGRIDLVHARGTNQGTEDPSAAIDPPGTVEVYDWKTSSNVERYGKTAAQLGRNVQMLAYALWVLINSPETNYVRVSHGYFQTKGKRLTRKVTTLLTRAEVFARWEYADNLARRIVAAAREPDPNKVEANLSACEKFGGCPHRAYCDAGKVRGLKGFFPKAADKLVQIGAKPTKGLPVGFLDKLRKTDAERKAADKPAPTADPRFKPAWDAILALGIGEPLLKGEALEQYCLAEKCEINGYKGGSGDMGKATIETLDELLEIAAECAAETAGAEDKANADATRQKPADDKPAVTPLSPDAPSSDPKMASAGAEGKDPIKPDKKPPKAKPAPKADPKPTTTKAAATSTTETASVALESDDIMLLVDCRANRPTTDLAPIIRRKWDEMTESAGMDPRASEAKPFSHGGWEGVLATLLSDPAETPIPGGVYHLDADGSRVMKVAVEALAPRIHMLIRGRG